GRVIHDLGNHNGADLRVGIGQAGSGAKLGERLGIVLPERTRAHGDELFAGIAGDVTSKRYGVLGWAETGVGAEAGQCAVARAAGKVNVVPFTGAQGEGGGTAVGVIELIFVEDFESIGRQNCAVRDAIFLEPRLGVTEEPAADVEVAG